MEKKLDDYWVPGAVFGIFFMVTMVLVNVIYREGGDLHDLIFIQGCTIVSLGFFFFFMIALDLKRIKAKLKLIEGQKCDENPTLNVELTKN